jgi:hypothetical protein
MTILMYAFVSVTYKMVLEKCVENLISSPFYFKKLKFVFFLNSYMMLVTLYKSSFTYASPYITLFKPIAMLCGTDNIQ